jgi:hypothetical protein
MWGLTVSACYEDKSKMFPVRSMKAYKASFISEWWSVVSFTHWPLCLGQSTPDISLLEDWLWFRAGLDVLKKRNIYCLCQESYSWKFSPQAWHGQCAIFENITFCRQQWQDIFITNTLHCRLWHFPFSKKPFPFHERVKVFVSNKQLKV